jgi:hypothetical protein
MAELIIKKKLALVNGIYRNDGGWSVVDGWIDYKKKNSFG